MAYKIECKKFKQYNTEEAFLSVYGEDGSKPRPLAYPTSYPCLVKEVTVVPKASVHEDIVLQFDYNI